MKRILHIIIIIFALLAALVLAGSTFGVFPPEEPAPEEPIPDIEEEITYEVVLPGGNNPDSAFMRESAPERYYPTTELKFKAGKYDGGEIIAYLGYLNDFYDAKYGFCDKNGKIISDPYYSSVTVAKRKDEKLYIATKQIGEDKKEIDIITTDGKKVLGYDDYSVMFDYNSNIDGISGNVSSSDYICVAKNGKWGIIDFTGKEIIRPKYPYKVFFNEGIGAVLSADKKSYYYVDDKGFGVIEKTFIFDDKADSEYMFINKLFYNGVAVFCENGKYGAIDKTGAIIIPAEYDYLEPFIYGMSVAKKNGLQGVLGAGGNIIYDFSVEYLYVVGENLINVSDEKGTLKYIDGTGAEVFPSAADDSGYEYETKNNTDTIIKKDGRELYLENAIVYQLLDDEHFLVKKTTLSEDPMTGAETADDIFQVIDFNKGLMAEFDCEYATGYGSLILTEDGKGGGFLCDFTGKKVNEDRLDWLYRGFSYFPARGERYVGAVDETGAWIIRLPFFAED